ncbi:MAG: adenosine-specific kinase [Candidatus Omnitrophica bacterium]|nr:adenosine-specific kinase [Candidatus Omnitrophota bacterium]
MKFESVKINKPAEVNVIIGQSHFIKSVEDLYEALVNSVPSLEFAIAFSEASGACKVRIEGTNNELKKLAQDNAIACGCGHTFYIFLKNAYPINVLNAIKMVPEVCNIFCATANPVEVIVAETEIGRGIMGVIDGCPPKGVEQSEDLVWRKNLLRKIGYKL